MAGVVPHFEVEVASYHGTQVRVRTATSVQGYLIDPGSRDATGLMLWPASHLLCFWLASDRLLAGLGLASRLHMVKRYD